MIRRFNYTGRTKLARNRVEIALHKDKEGKYFSAKIDLAGLKLPGEARIYIEANYKGVYQRFSFGTVSNIKQPDSTRLTELPETELAYFDISIVDEQNKMGLLLSKASGIAVSTEGFPNDRLPLLYVNPVDLKNQFWKLSFDTSDDGRPTLEINKNIPEIFDLAKNDIKFISLVYPTAFRGVLEKLIREDNFEDAEDGWISQWLKFIRLTLGIKHDPEMGNDGGELSADQELWIDDCVNEFCTKLRLFEKFTV